MTGVASRGLAIALASSCPTSIDWGLCLPTSGETGLQGADRFSLLPGNSKSCWLLLGAGWGGPGREDQHEALGGVGWGERPVLGLLSAWTGCVPQYLSAFCGYEACWRLGLCVDVLCPWLGILCFHYACCMLVAGPV